MLWINKSYERERGIAIYDDAQLITPEIRRRKLAYVPNKNFSMSANKSKRQ